MTWERTTRQNSVRDEVKLALEAKNRARRYGIQGVTYLACGSFMVAYFLGWMLFTHNLAWLVMVILGVCYAFLGRFYMRTLTRRALAIYESRMEEARSMARLWKSLDDFDGIFGSKIADSLEQAFKNIEEEAE